MNDEETEKRINETNERTIILLKKFSALMREESNPLVWLSTFLYSINDFIECQEDPLEAQEEFICLLRMTNDKSRILKSMQGDRDS